jgi:hypothetical protein
MARVRNHVRNRPHVRLRRAGATLAALALAAASAAAQPGRDIFVLTSTNGTANDVVVFKLETSGTPSLSLVNMLPTGGAGGFSGAGAGALQFSGDLGAVVNFGSNSVSQLQRMGNSIVVARTVTLAPNCVKPVSTALRANQMFVVGSNCAESHAWPSGTIDGTVVKLSDPSAAQIVAGETWAAVTMTSGSVLQLPLNGQALNGTSTAITLPADANNTPLGAAFWGDLLAFNPAHSPDSFALVNSARQVFPVVGPQPPYPSNAPCWLAKGAGNIWYSGNSPGHAISIFFSDSQGGVFYKSVSLAGAPTDITVSADRRWLAVIFTEADGAHIAVFSIDYYGDLTPVATTMPVGISAFDGVAFSQ